MENIRYDNRIQSIHTSLNRQNLKNGLAIRNVNAYFMDPNDATNIDDRIKHRHEFAHFFSYNATGLAEFHRIFIDYKETILELGIKHLINKKKNEKIEIPFYVGNDLVKFKNSQLGKALNQIQEQEAYLFGYGSKLSVYEIFDLSQQNEFFSFIGYDGINDYKVLFYRNVVKQLLDTSEYQYAINPDLNLPTYQDKTGKIRKYSSRSVMEAYAITIEAVAEYIKKVEFGKGDKPRTKKKRIPSVLDTSSLKLCLEILTKKSPDIESYVNCKFYSTSVYWCISLVTFTALLVPSIQYDDDSIVIMGGLKQLNPSHRLAHILHLINLGKLDHPSVTYPVFDKSPINDEIIFNWINKACSALGDTWSLKFIMKAERSVSADPRNYGYDSQFNRPTKISWVAKHSFMNDIYGAISEAAAYHENFIIPYVITSDNTILANTYTSKNQIDTIGRYVYSNKSYIYEMMLTDVNWHIYLSKIRLNKKLILQAIYSLLETLDRAIDKSDIDIRSQFID